MFRASRRGEGGNPLACARGMGKQQGGMGIAGLFGITCGIVVL